MLAMITLTLDPEYVDKPLKSVRAVSYQHTLVESQVAAYALNIFHEAAGVIPDL